MIADMHIQSVFNRFGYSDGKHGSGCCEGWHTDDLLLPIISIMIIPQKDITFEFDIGRYKEAIDALKEKYKSKILILMGVELGLQEHLGGRYRKLVEGYPFDFIIGSQHLVGNKDPYYPETF